MDRTASFIVGVVEVLELGEEAASRSLFSPVTGHVALDHEHELLPREPVAGREVVHSTAR